MRTLIAFLLGGGAALAQAPQPAPAPTPGNPGMAFIRDNYSKFEYRIPMRDGVKLFTSVYVPKDAATDGKTYPIMLSRTPYSVRPYGEDQYPDQPGPLGILRAGEVHLRLPGCARPLLERGRVCARAALQSRQERRKRHRREQRHLRHHRLAGEERPWQHRQGRGMGYLAAGLLLHLRHAGRASRAGGRLSASARHGLLSGRRQLPQRRLHAGAPLQLLSGLPPARRRPGAAARAAIPFDFGTPDGYEFYLEHGLARQCRREVLQA